MVKFTNRRHYTVIYSNSLRMRKIYKNPRDSPPYPWKTHQRYLKAQKGPSRPKERGLYYKHLSTFIFQFLKNKNNDVYKQRPVVPEVYTCISSSDKDDPSGRGGTAVDASFNNSSNRIALSTATSPSSKQYILR